MDPRLTILSEQLLRYRELLAMSYAQKDAIQKGDLQHFAALLTARQELIGRVREIADTLGGDWADLPDDDRDTLRRLMSEAAMLLEKLVSLDKENERLLEVKVTTAGTTEKATASDERAAYPRGSGRRQGASGLLDRTK